MISILITVTILLSVASADPAVVISNGLLTSPIASAAYLGPASAPLVASVGAVGALTALPVSPVAGAVPYTSVSDYRYSYGSALNYQDYAPVVSSAALSLPYTVPYAYAADWYYRK